MDIPPAPPTPTTAALNVPLSPEPSPLGKIAQTYQALHVRVAANQMQIQNNRQNIKALRARIQEIHGGVPDFDERNEEQNLRQSLLGVQENSCRTLIENTQQIRDNILENSAHAESLLASLKDGVALLELHVQHIRAIEALLDNLKQERNLEDKLLEIDVMIEELATKLNAAV